MKNNNKLQNFQDFIKAGNFNEVKAMVADGIDIHHENDYFLYLAAFSKHKNIQEYFIDIGLSPEKTKARMEVAHPQLLQDLRNYRIKKEIIDYKDKLNHDLHALQKPNKKIKI